MILTQILIMQLIEEVKSERTSGAIEGWNLILKHSDHKQHRLRPDVFLAKHFPLVLGRQLTFVDLLSASNKTRIMVGSCMHIQ